MTRLVLFTGRRTLEVAAVVLRREIGLRRPKVDVDAIFRDFVVFGNVFVDFVFGLDLTVDEVAEDFSLQLRLVIQSAAQIIIRSRGKRVRL